MKNFIHNTQYSLLSLKLISIRLYFKCDGCWLFLCIHQFIDISLDKLVGRRRWSVFYTSTIKAEYFATQFLQLTYVHMNIRTIEPAAYEISQKVLIHHEWHVILISIDLSAFPISNTQLKALVVTIDCVTVKEARHHACIRFMGTLCVSS